MCGGGRQLGLFVNRSLENCLSAGDVSPISMSPISQSQFIPLGEILCLAISAMNSARKPVTQEALMEHLTTCFPGNGNDGSSRVSVGQKTVSAKMDQKLFLVL